MFGVDDLVMGGISALGGYFTNQMNNDASMERQMQAQQFNSAQAERQMAFQKESVLQQQAYQTEMSNSAYQRSRADMIKAGLNPILAASSGGASTPSSSAMGGASASSSPIAPNNSDFIGKGVASAMASKAMTAEVDKKRKELENLDLTATNIVADTKKKVADASVSGEQAKNLQVDNKIKSAGVNVALGEAAKSDVERRYFKSAAGDALHTAAMGGRDVDQTVAAVPGLASTAKSVKQLLGKRTGSTETTRDGSSTFNERYGF